MKIFKTLQEQSKRRDNAPMERLGYIKIRTAIESMAEKYLTQADAILRFEALPSTIDGVLYCVESSAFQEKFDFIQESETIFAIKLKELDIL